MATLDQPITADEVRDRMRALLVEVVNTMARELVDRWGVAPDEAMTLVKAALGEAFVEETQ